MGENGSKPVRRFRSVRPQDPQDAPRETAESVLPGVPRVGALDALLREVDSLRLTLETDLSLAASAVEAGATSVAADIIDSDRQGLRGFESRALAHLAELADVDDPASRTRWWTRVPVAPFVAAAAVVGFLVAVVPQDLSPAPHEVTVASASASQSLEQLTRLAASGNTSEVRSAAVTLHSQLMVLVAQAGNDPAAAKQGLLLLSAERDVIAQSGDSQALRDVLAASNHLSRLIIQALPASVRTNAPTPAVVVPDPTPPASRPSTGPSPRPSTQPTAQPTAQPTSQPTGQSTPKPTSSPRPTSSPTGSPGVLPTNPALKP